MTTSEMVLYVLGGITVPTIAFFMGSFHKTTKEGIKENLEANHKQDVQIALASEKVMEAEIRRKESEINRNEQMITLAKDMSEMSNRMRERDSDVIELKSRNVFVAKELRQLRKDLEEVKKNSIHE